MAATLVICGPTATGKSNLGLALADRFGWDVISADSRQLYRGMDIGTGKDLPPHASFVPTGTLIVGQETYSLGYYTVNSIRHWLYDVASPAQPVHVGLYQAAFAQVSQDLRLHQRSYLVVGGAGFYLKSVFQPPETLTVPPDSDLRQRLEQLDLPKLQQALITKDAGKWALMNHSDRFNPRRLIRAIEVAGSSKPETPLAAATDLIWVGLTAPFAYLHDRIEARVNQRLKQGFLEEIQGLIQQYPGFLDLPSGRTLGYAQLGQYIVGVTSKEQALTNWLQAEIQYAKRQLTWFNQQADVIWFDITQDNWYAQVIDTLQPRLAYDSNHAQN